MLLPMVLVKDVWCKIQYCQVISETVAEETTSLLGLNPNAMEVPKRIQEADRKHMPIISLAPLSMVDPLLTPPLLLPQPNMIPLKQMRRCSNWQKMSNH